MKLLSRYPAVVTYIITVPFAFCILDTRCNRSCSLNLQFVRILSSEVQYFIYKERVQGNMYTNHVLFRYAFKAVISDYELRINMNLNTSI